MSFLFLENKPTMHSLKNRDPDNDSHLVLVFGLILEKHMVRDTEVWKEVKRVCAEKDWICESQTSTEKIWIKVKEKKF